MKHMTSKLLCVKEATLEHAVTQMQKKIDTCLSAVGGGWTLAGAVSVATYPSKDDFHVEGQAMIFVLVATLTRPQ